ncbi:thioredoxin family protein [Fredinandcohnia sp. 179-A 10B2 NHS]|uniref:thioredoxin family protein n=1 Tax=Fredinandcohnia sp. 179-A 10B2 NHS TaxID=3235176 RepID=UPI0039A0D4E0
MREFQTLTSIEEVQSFKEIQGLSFLYISRTNCSVCHALLPQIKEVMSDFPEIKKGYVNADDVEEIAGFLSIFTVPVLILFIDGKEYLREARFVPIEQFTEKLSKIYRSYLE